MTRVPDSRAPKFGDRPIVVIEQGGTAERTFNAADRIIDNITTTIVFSYYKLNPYREIAKEQEQTDYSFIYLCGGDLSPPNHQVVPARRDGRYFVYGFDQGWGRFCAGSLEARSA